MCGDKPCRQNGSVIQPNLGHGRVTATHPSGGFLRSELTSLLWNQRSPAKFLSRPSLTLLPDWAQGPGPSPLPGFGRAGGLGDDAPLRAWVPWDIISPKARSTCQGPFTAFCKGHSSGPGRAPRALHPQLPRAGATPLTESSSGFFLGFSLSLAGGRTSFRPSRWERRVWPWGVGPGHGCWCSPSVCPFGGVL